MRVHLTCTCGVPLNCLDMVAACTSRVLQDANGRNWCPFCYVEEHSEVDLSGLWTRYVCVACGGAIGSSPVNDIVHRLQDQGLDVIGVTIRQGQSFRAYLPGDTAWAAVPYGEAPEVRRISIPAGRTRCGCNKCSQIRNVIWEQGAPA